MEPHETAAPAEHRHSFHQELEAIRKEIVILAAAVIEAIPRATGVLLDQDLEGAEYMISADDQIDARALDLEQRCYQVLALQSPVASDLRAIVAAVRIIAEAERSADLAVNICKAARRLYDRQIDARLRGLIGRMAEQAQVLYRTAVDAYVERDAAKASAVDDMDSVLDGLHYELIEAIFESHANGKTDLHVAVQMAMVARFYERIGDHAVNIAERVQYLVTGALPETQGVSQYRRITADQTALAEPAESP
jgi:phosphate transport system protein